MTAIRAAHESSWLHSVAEKRRDVDVAEIFRAELGPLDRTTHRLLLGFGLGLAAEAGGDDCDFDLTLHGLVADDAEDDVGAGIGRRAYDLGRFLDLLQCDVLAGGGVEKDALGAVDRRFGQRAGYRLLGGVLRARGAWAVASAPGGLPGVLHARLPVGEVAGAHSHRVCQV